MQEMHKGNYTYATKELPHTQLKKSNTHQVRHANEWKSANELKTFKPLTASKTFIQH
jgi:hypothetical protein